MIQFEVTVYLRSNHNNILLNCDALKRLMLQTNEHYMLLLFRFYFYFLLIRE